ncbi:MAG TPA: hypothetical protein VIH18_31725 [Candidatus Binatia bacterium]
MSKLPTHNQPEVARSPKPAETEAWKAGNSSEGWQRSAQPAAPPLGLSQAAHGVPNLSDVLRQLTSSRARHRVVLQMQRSFGNSYTRRAIERSRATDLNSLARSPHHKGRRLEQSPVARAAAQELASVDPVESESPAQSLEITPPFGDPPDTPDSNTSNKQAPHGSRSLALTGAGDAAPNLGAIQRAIGPRLGSDVRNTPGRTIRRTQVHPRESTASARPVVQRDLLDDFTDTVSDVASSAADKVSDVASDAVDAVSDVASDAADAVSGVIDSVIGELRKAFDAIVGQITEVWDTVKSGVTNAVDAVIRQATGLLGGIGAFFGAIGTALISLNVDSLRAAWAGIIGAADAALAGVQGLVAQITATVDGFWSGLKRLADGLIGGLRNQAEGLIGRLPGPVQGTARSLWKTIEEKLTSTWQTIESGWTSLRESALKRVDEVVAKVAGVVTSIKNSVISTIIETLDQVKGLFNFIKQVIANPDSLIEPIVQEITGRLQGLPDKAKGEAQTKTQEQAAQGPGAEVPAPARAQATPVVPIQRVIQRDAAAAGAPRSTLGVGEVISGCWDFITDKLATIWGNLWGTVKEMVIGVLDPRAIWKGLKEDWANMTKELSTRAGRFESIRTDSWDGFWEDLRRFLSNLIDFPLIIWRTANAMLGRLSVYIGLAIILGGAVAGAIAGATGGAIFGSVVPAAGTAAGGGVGILGGAWAGAQAGYALAETIGLVLLVSFVAGEQVSIIKALNDLLWVPQSADEQNEDFNQATDSTIAVVTAGLLMLIAFIGVAIAKRVWAFVKSIPGRFKPKPKAVEPTEVKPPQDRPSETKPPEELGVEGGKKVLAEEPTADGKHKIKITEDGTCLYCTECGRLTKEYAVELNDPANADILTKLDNADKMSNPKLKARRMAEIEAELQKIRNNNPNPIDPRAARAARIQLLARDPAHGGKVTPGSLREAEVAVSLEESGKVSGPIQRDPTGAADFLDGSAKPWDVKGPNSHQPPANGGFDLATDAGKIDASLALGENVMVDTGQMTAADIATLKAEGVTRGWGAKVQFFP